MDGLGYETASVFIVRSMQLFNTAGSIHLQYNAEVGVFAANSPVAFTESLYDLQWVSNVSLSMGRSSKPTGF